MTNYNTNNQLLTYNDLLNENNRLQAIIINLQQEKEKYNKCTSTVYDPNRMTDQKALIEAKVRYAVLEKNKEIETLVKDRVELQKELKEFKDKYYKLQEDNLYLKKTVKNQETIIHIAAGYISSTPRFSKEHPMNVLSWLKGVALP